MSQTTALDLSKPKAPAAPPPSFAEFVRKKVSTVLAGKKGDDFVTSLVSLTNQDLALKECDPMSLISAAMQAQSLNLSLNRQLGQAWVVAFKDNRNHRTMATFQLGYKGYIQLAIRSGQYRTINVLPIKEGELIRYDPLNEDLHVEMIQDEFAREEAPTIGYYAMFEYLNGFRKAMYWSRAKMVSHAKKYSQAYRRDLEKGWNNSFWSKDFDSMAIKTMIRQIIGKWGVMSVEMQKAYEADMRVVSEDGNVGEMVDADYMESKTLDLGAGEAIEAGSAHTPINPETGEVQDTPENAEKSARAEQLAALQALREEAKAAWEATGATLEEAEKLVNAFQPKWTTAQCNKVLAEAQNRATKPHTVPTLKTFHCKSLGREVSIKECQNGCPEIGDCSTYSEATA